MQVHHQMTTIIPQPKVRKARPLAATLFTALLLTFASLLTDNALAQSSQQERALMDYAKQYDKEQREKRADEFQRKIDGGIGSTAATNAWTNLLWIFGLTAVGAVGWVFFSNRSKVTIEDSDIKKLHAESYLGNLSKEQVAKLSVKEICAKTGKRSVQVRYALDTLAWCAADYDGTILGKIEESSKNATQNPGEFSGKSQEEINKIVQARAQYERAIKKIEKQEEQESNPANRGFHLTLFGKPKCSISWYITCCDAQGKILPKYGIYDYLGETMEGADEFHNKEIVNITYTDAPPPDCSQITISIYMKNSLKKIKYVPVYVSTAGDDDNDGKESIAEILAQIRTCGISSTPSAYEWKFDTTTEKISQLGYFERKKDDSWEFIETQGVFVDATSENLSPYETTQLSALDGKLQTK